jgi:hypothetical protein
MTTEVKTELKREAQLKDEPKEKRDAPVLKDLEADAETADNVVGGPARCTSRKSDC